MKVQDDGNEETKLLTSSLGLRMETREQLNIIPGFPVITGKLHQKLKIGYDQ